MYAQLSSSYNWSMLNNKKQLDQLLQAVIVNGNSITFDKMPVTYSTLKNRQKSIILTNITEAISSGEIAMVDCDPEKIRIPLYLPFIIISDGGGVNSCKGLVFLNNCEGSMVGDEYQCNATKLKVALESCYLALQMFLHRNDTKLQSPQIIRPSVKVYSHIVMECINRKFSIKLSPDIYNSVMYTVSKYFVQTVMGYSSNESVLDSYCLSQCINPNIQTIRSIVDNIPDTAYQNIQTLITSLAGNEQMKTRLARLTVGGFIESYINMYDSSMLLALENYSYFIFNVFSVTARTYINRYQMLENIVGDDGKKLYAALVTTLS